MFHFDIGDPAPGCAVSGPTSKRDPCWPDVLAEGPRQGPVLDWLDRNLKAPDGKYWYGANPYSMTAGCTRPSDCFRVPPYAANPCCTDMITVKSGARWILGWLFNPFNRPLSPAEVAAAYTAERARAARLQEEREAAEVTTAMDTLSTPTGAVRPPLVTVGETPPPPPADAAPATRFGAPPVAAGTKALRFAALMSAWGGLIVVSAIVFAVWAIVGRTKKA